METLCDILHLAGAICMILFAGAGFALIIRWWNRLVIMETQIRFIFEIENELLLKSKGQTPRVSHFSKEFFEKGEDQILNGAPPFTSIDVSDLPIHENQRHLLSQVRTVKPRVTEKTTTTEPII